MTQEVKIYIELTTEVDVELSKAQITKQIETNLKFGVGINIVKSFITIHEEKDIYQNK